MLEFDRINVCKGIDINETSSLRECIICHYYYFLKVNFKFMPKVCDYCHDMTQIFMNFDDVTTVTVEINDYRFIFKA